MEGRPRLQAPNHPRRLDVDIQPRPRRAETLASQPRALTVIVRLFPAESAGPLPGVEACSRAARGSFSRSVSKSG